MFFIGIPIQYYLIVILPTIVIGGIASLLVKSTFKKYSKIGTAKGYTGAQAAAEMLRRAGIHDVEIRQVGGFLSDHYNPTNRTLGLSADNYQGQSIAAIGIACHEAGHAIQHAESYAFLGLRTKLVPLTSVCGKAYIWILIASGFFHRPELMVVGLGICLVTLLFTLVTLPVEWDASRRAKLAMINQNFLRQEENDGAVKVLNAAFLTYLAAALTSMISVLYWLMLLAGGSRD
jgi:Zn-dependent membrane protease YugP